MKSATRALVVVLIVATGCSSGNRVDAAFHELDQAVPAEWRRLSAEDSANARSARYETEGEPAEVAARLRSSLVGQGFMIFPGSGLPDRSVSAPPVTNNQTPATVALPTPAEPDPVDAIQVSGLRGEERLGATQSVTFYPGPRPGWTAVVVNAAVED